MVRHLLSFLVLAMFAMTSACGVLPFGGGPAESLVGATWFGTDGDPVSGSTINLIRGPGHCDWEAALMMHVGWPPGTEAVGDMPWRQYLRDPKGVLPDNVELRSTLETDAVLPDNASYTGLHTDTAELWLGPDEGDAAVYLAFEDGAVERWPRPDEPVACA